MSFLIDPSLASDQLTGVLNRIGFLHSLNLWLQEGAIWNTQVVLLMCDVDNLKSLHDTHGHAPIDELLRSIGQTLQAHIEPRHGQAIGRVGGDEFVVLLPRYAVWKRGAQPSDEAVAFAEQLRNAVAELRVCGYQNEFMSRVTLSFGIAIAPQHGHDAVSLFRAADSALQRAKDEGRDCVRVAE